MRGMSKKDTLACQVSLGLFAGLLGIASTAHGAAPNGVPALDDKGVRAGDVTVHDYDAGTQTLNITSNSDNNVIGWKDFSIEKNHTVQFDSGTQTHNYLNIVTGNVTSQIAGKMEGGKNVYIANPHGVVFADGASVNVGNLYVTTRDLNANAIGTAVGNGTIDLNAPTSAGVTGNIINETAASSAGLAQADIVSLIDGSGSVKANKIVMEGKSVRILNDAGLTVPQRTDVPAPTPPMSNYGIYAIADQSPLEVEVGSTKTVRPHKGYVHVGYAGSQPAVGNTSGSEGKYRNLTADNMYKLVGSKTDLDAIHTGSTANLAGNYMLRSDIDFAGATHTPIGTNAAKFTGKFDGMFHEIKNMTVASGDATDYAGLFGNTSGAEIANVGIRDANLSTLDYGGAVVGKAESGTHIFNVYNEVTSATPVATKKIGDASLHEAGGIVGRLDGSSLDNAYNTAPINSQAAGVAGWIQGASQIYAVYNTGVLEAGTSRAVYKALGGSSFIKNAYTSQGTQLGIADSTVNAYDSYATSTGKAKLVNTDKVTGTAVNDKDAKQASSYGGWDISDEGGANKTWRIFADHSNPLLTAFMQGTVQAEYSYADFSRPNKDNKSTYAANTYTDMIAGTLKKNGGESMPENRTYDATYRTLTKENGMKVGGISDVTVVGYTAPASTSDPKAIQINTDGRRNAGKEALLYSGQHGYDVAGANVKIDKRKVVGSWNDLTIEKEYDGTTTATKALQNALKADSIRITGVIDGDDATLGMSSTNPVVANFDSANAGYGKALTISGNFELTGADAANYENIKAADLTPPVSGLKGNIRQKKLVVGLNSAKSYDKTYDRTADVADDVNPQKVAGSDVLTLAAKTAPPSPTADPFTAGVVDLNKSNITAKYMTGKTASDTEAKDVKMDGTAVANRDIAYKNIKLVNGTGDKTNYMLVDAQGNVLYRDEAPGEAAYKAATETATDYSNITNADNKANDRYIGAVTTAGELWGEGKILKRRIDASAFKVTGEDKVYDGTDYLVVDGTKRKVQAPDAVTGSNTNVITEDKDQLIFTISATDKKAYYKNTPTATANTKDVYAATNTNGAQYLSYTLKASDKTNGKTLANYELDLGGGTTRALNTTDTYSATGAGKITPRTVYVDLLKKDGIDKTYDGNATSNATAFGTNFGYTTTAANANKLVHDGGAQPDGTAAPNDGASITATAVYKTKSGHTEQDKDVYRTGNALTGAVEDNGKNVKYTVTLTGTNAATNYVLSYTPTGGTATTGSSLTMTGTGKITPKKLTLNAPGNVTRAYDTTSKVYASQLPTSYTNVTNGVEAGDTVHLNFGTGTTVVGTYYTDSTLATEAKDANADKNGTLKAGKQNYTVKYTFTPTLDNGNYEVDATTPPTGLGTIKQLEVTNANFEMNFGEKTKTFNGTTTVEGGAPLSALKIGGVDLLTTPGSYTLVGGRYSDEHATHDKDGTLLAGKSKLAVTYTISLPGENRGNYDFSGFVTSGEYTKTGNMYDGYTISRTRPGVGSIRQRLINPTVAKPLVTKDYNGKRDVVDGNGNPSASASLVNMPELITGKGSNVSKAEYIDKNVGKNKTVTYTPAISDDYKSDYYFSVASLTGQGDIDPLQIDVNFKRANKTYDGTADVDKAASDWGYEFVPQRRDPLFSRTAGIIADDVTNGELKFDTDKLTAQYVDANGNPQSDAGNYENRVRYGNIQKALTSSNYQIVNVGSTNIVPTDTKWGSGTITKRTFNASDIDIAIGAATKVYDGTTAVKKAGNASDAKDYIQHFKMHLGGTIGWTDYELGKDYSLDGAAYDNANVASNNGTGTVRYRLSLKNSDGTDGVLSKNYDFTNLPANYTYDSSTGILTRTTATNTIMKRPVYAHVVNDNVTKTYNAKSDVIDGNNNALTGESLVHFERASEGTADRGLLDADKNRNATKAVYDTKVAGTGKTVNYTLLFSDNATVNNDLSANYELQDSNNVPVTTLQTTQNTINRRALKLKADPVTKDYDATKTVKVGGTPSTTGVGLDFVGGDLQTDENNRQDVVNLGNAYTREYNSPNATRTEEAKKNNVTYSGIKLVAGGDAANYFLADADGTALTGNDTAGFTMKGDGVINPLTVKKSNLKMTFRTVPISKTYDGTAYVDGDTENPAAWRSYITDSYVTDDSNNPLFNIAIDKVNSATYRTGVAAGSDGTADKNAADGKKVLFNIKFSDADQNNFEFASDFYSGSAGTDRMLRGDDGSSTYNVYTTGDIKKRILTAALGQTSNIHKVYDGGLEADKDNLRVNNFLEGDKDQLDKSAVFDRSNASVSPGETANARTITYTATLTGDAVGNYAFDSLTGSAQKVLTATGDIEKRKVYARVTAPRVKTYDATTKVLIDGAAPADGDALVTLGRNNSNDADTGLVDGKGTNKTTAVYAGANAADASDSPNKQVDYKLAIDGSDADGAFADNYIVYDKDGNVVYNTATGRDTLTTSDNTINRAPLSVKAERATKEYDGGRRVKNPSPERLLNITGGWQGSDSGDLNRSGTDSYTTTYLDENVNDKGVDYGNVKIVGEGATKASNYVLSYNGKDVERNGEVYHLHGDGEITKRILTGNDLAPGFTTAPIKKTYDGTTDVKDPSQYVQYMRTRYKKDDGTDLDLAANGYTVERADYLDKADGTKAKDVGKGKDVKFQFALNDGNFDYTGLTGWQPDANGVYHFSENYGREKVTNPDGSISETGRGEITGRNVGVTLHLVQKLYDGTTDVKNGYYTRDDDGKLVEHGNVDVDWNKVISLNGKSGKIAGDENSGFANGEGFDFNVEAKYEDEKVNRGSQFTNSAKRVTYDVRLKDASANKNYTFKYRVVDANGKELAAQDTAQTFVDPKGNDGHSFKGLGDIWQKRLTLKKDGIDKVYDGNANLTEALKKGLQFDGVAQRDRDAFDFSKNDARAQGFVNRISGRYGDLSADGIFTENKHVKRPQGNINGTPEARDLEITGVKSAFESLLQRDDVANNYFYDDANTVYGKGTITPVKATLKKQWTGGDFTKMYDGDPLVRIGGNKLGASFATEEEREANRKAFHDKLNLSVDLGTGEIVQLDYSLYGDAESDFDGDRPRYQKLVDGRYDNDANVLNSTDPNDNLKDIVYKLKSIDGDKNWKPDAENYKDWDLTEDPLGKEIRLSDADANTATGSSAKPQAYITPRAITLTADEYSKIYDGTAGVAAPSLSADALAAKQKELRDKLHVTDDKTQKLLRDDGVDFTVDVQNSAFLDKNTPNADVVRDSAGNVPTNGKSIAYKLEKTGSVLKQANYTLPASAAQTDTFIAAGSIAPRTVRVRFNPANDATPDKIYDGTQDAVKDGKLFSRTFEIVPQGVDEGVVEQDANDVELNKTSNIGRFASPNVQTENGGVQSVYYYNDSLKLKDSGTGKASNYTLEKDNLQDTARITPRPLDIYLKDGDIRKEYDGTTAVKDKFLAENNLALLDRNPDITDANGNTIVKKPELPTWSAGEKATYDEKNAGNRTVTYTPSWSDKNFILRKGQKTVNPTDPTDPTSALAEVRNLTYTSVDAEGKPQLQDGAYGMKIEADGVIDRRQIKISAAKDAKKIYDGRTNVVDPLGNLSFTYNGTEAEQNEANGIVKGEGDQLKAALRVRGVYRNENNTEDDANAADNETQEHKTHAVRYTFEKNEGRDPVLANYEIATDAGGNTVLGTGIIERRTLNVRPDRQATYEGKGNVNYTGRVEDGSAAVNGNSPLTPEVEAELRDLNRKIFYGPAAGADYSTPGQTDIYGWYLRDDGTPARASGRYDANYTFDLQATKLSIAPRIDGVLPERTLRPDSKVYEYAAFDERNSFGTRNDTDAALSYRDQGINMGTTTTPQAGIVSGGTNIGGTGIAGAGSGGANIGGAGAAGAGAGNIAGAGTAGTGWLNGNAANEATQAAGMNAGRGAQSGNAALAGGTAGIGGSVGGGSTAGAGGSYRPGTAGSATIGGNVGSGSTAGAGGSYRPGTAGSATIGGNAGSGSTAGAGASYRPGTAGSVDRGLAAAAGMSNAAGGATAGSTAQSSTRAGASSAASSGYSGGGYSTVDRALADAAGQSIGSNAGYYSGRGYSRSDDDEEEEIRRRARNQASA